MSFPARALLFLVRVYQAFFSALMPSACKFYPSCSHYAAEAVAVHGARRGVWLALRRIGRCHPFSPGGVDLVPGAEEDLSGVGFSVGGVAEDGNQIRGRGTGQNQQAEACSTENQEPQAEAYATERQRPRAEARATSEEVHS